MLTFCDTIDGVNIEDEIVLFCIPADWFLLMTHS